MSERDILDIVATARSTNPDKGVKKLVAEVSALPGLEHVGSREIRQALTVLEASTSRVAEPSKTSSPSTMRAELAAHLGDRSRVGGAKSDERGRSLVACKPLSAGEVVMRCEPFTTMLHPQHWGERCSLCFRRLDGPALLCSAGCMVTYCDRKCQEADSHDHRHECEKLANARELFPGDVEGMLDALADALMLGRVMRAKSSMSSDSAFGSTDLAEHAISDVDEMVENAEMARPNGTFWLWLWLQ